MDIIKVMETFKSQEDCIAYLEHLRFNSYCPLCENSNIAKKKEHSETGRWQLMEHITITAKNELISFSQKPRSDTIADTSTKRKYSSISSSAAYLSTVTRPTI